MMNPALASPPSSRQERLGLALSEIARTVAESLELKDVFSRVAEAARQVLPFETMGVSVAHDCDCPFEDVENVKFSAFAVAGEGGTEELGQYRRSDISPGLRLKETNKVFRHADVRTVLDSSFLLDRRIQSLDCRSLMVCLLPAARPLGSIWFASPRAGVFDPEDELAVLAIADLVALAVQHDRLFREERERRRRSETLEALLPTLSKALDIREVFDQLSVAVGGVLPHDRMALGLFSEDRKAVRIHAYTGERVPDMPETVRIDCDPNAEADWSFFLVRDLRQEPGCCEEKYEIMKRDGMRSLLRVPVRLEGEIVGGLNFISRNVGQYREEDADIARRIADQIALVLSHEKLAGEARVAAEARERADRLEATVQTLARELEMMGRGRVVGVSASWKEVLTQIGRVATAETTVLVTGESGTGKEIVASLIHQGSPRSGKPLVAINCAALPEQLLESELFGHEKGAFTGAIATKIGRIEQAAGGTLFLDEIGEMSALVQAKFLRVLEEREFQRLGGTRTLKADVRVIAATNLDLAKAMVEQQFREDLYYRLNVFQIHIPPLRERREDILPLAEMFVEELGPTIGRPAAGISKDARDWLLAYPWPGNVRELRNAIERAILLCDGGLITAEHLPPPRAGNGRGARVPVLPSNQSLGDVERGLVENALKEARNNKTLAARLLGISRSQLYSRIEKYGIS